MDRTTICVPGLVLLLAACILISGCATSDTDDQVVQPTVTTSAAAQYSEGDIVKNPDSSAGNAWLVIGYDAATDTYERALVYQNADGTWGYRKDTRTENAGRAVMEKVYTEIVENRLPSSVPVITPTIVTAEPTPTLKTTSAAATPTASTAPVISRVIPDKGDAGTTVTITDLVGYNFQNGANVTLRRSGSNEVHATGVRAVTSKSITCTFDIPADAVAGAWDLTVTNPDGQSSTYTNIFSVHRTASSLVTTLATSAGTVPINFIDPPNGFSNNYRQYTITGSKFQAGATVKLQKTGSSDIVGTYVTVNTDTQLQCFFQIPPGSFGVWDLSVTNPDSTYGIAYGKFVIN